MKLQKLAVAVILGLALGISAVSAQGFFNGFLTFDENGTGYFQATPTGPQIVLPSALIADPTGRSSVGVLAYQLPYISAAPGDILVREAEDPNLIGDVVTFYNPPTGGPTLLLFYSLGDIQWISPALGLAGWGTAWADITAPDFNNVLANPLGTPQTLNEIAVASSPIALGGSINYFVYLDSQGYAYKFYSDIPEPSTLGLLALGGLGLLWRKRS